MSSSQRLVAPALLASVFLIATSGLVYQLLAGTLASYVLGDSVAQFSFIIGLYLFAMGIGSYLSKFVEDDLLVRFVEIQLGIALAGGLSAPLLFRVYTSYGAFKVALYTFVVIIGTLVGLEIPILIRLLKFSLPLKDLVARVLSFDYVGALVASVLFPSLLLPKLGIHQTSVLFGAINAAVALLASSLFPLPRPVLFRLRAAAFTVLVALGFVFLWMGRVIQSSEATYYGAAIVHASQSPYQRVVMTQTKRATKLFLNGNLQFSSDDEYRYHEALVHPAIAALGRHPQRVLVLGGGDGLAVRELLRYPSVKHIDLVDLDAAVTELFSKHEIGRKLNGDSLLDGRVHVFNEDAFLFLDRPGEAYDLAVVDFPDPSNYAVGKLFTDTFYRKLREHIGVRGLAVIQATSPGFARRTYWSVAATLEAADFKVVPYHVYVPSFGDWGFHLAGGPGLVQPSELTCPTDLRFLDNATLGALFLFPPDQARVPGPVNKLNSQVLVPLYTDEWGEWAR